MSFLDWVNKNQAKQTSSEVPHARTHCVPRLQKVIDGEQGAPVGGEQPEPVHLPDGGEDRRSGSACCLAD